MTIVQLSNINYNSWLDEKTLRKYMTFVYQERTSLEYMDQCHGRQQDSCKSANFIRVLSSTSTFSPSFRISYYPQKYVQECIAWSLHLQIFYSFESSKYTVTKLWLVYHDVSTFRVQKIFLTFESGNNIRTPCILMHV